MTKEMCAKILAWLVCTGYHTEATTTRKDVYIKIMEAKTMANFFPYKEPVWEIHKEITKHIKEYEKQPHVNPQFVIDVEKYLGL